MRYIKSMEAYAESCNTAVTMGKFDGLHRGHQTLIDRIRAYAGEHRAKSVVVAFDMAPLHQKLGLTGQKVITNAERRYLLEDKVDVLLECPFTEEIYEMEAEEFIRSILLERLHAEYIAVGEDFRFGHGRQGDASLLKKWEKQGAFQVDIVKKERYHDREISSTYIKEILPDGEMELVNQLLGYPYTIIGEVVHGNRIGRTLGIPTMNLRPDRNKLLPAFGVYHCQVRLEGKWHNGICNIGIKPTVGEHNNISIECHLFAYQGNAYGKEIEVRIFHKERGEKKFADIDELKAQMQQDIRSGIRFFGPI